MEMFNVDELKERLSEYVVKYDRSSLNKEELKDFCKLMVEYCKLTRHAECELDTPEIKFKKLSDVNTLGNYNDYDNSIKINETFLDGILNKKTGLIDLIDTIGHEMMHYQQNSDMIEYDNLSMEQQRLIDEKAKASIDSYKNYFKLSEDDVKTLHDLLAPYLKEGEIPKGYEKIEDFYHDVSYASYYTLQSEREAREEGVNFALDFYQELSTGENQLPQEIKFIAKTILDYRKHLEDKAYDQNKEKINAFSEIYDMNEDKILEMVERIESGNAKCDIEDYTFALKYLIKNKTLDQKESLLKNAIFNGYNSFTDVIIESLQKEVDFKANKNHFSTFVSDCLTGKAYGNSELEIPFKSYWVDYAKILNQDDFEEVVKQIIKKDPNDAESIIFYCRGIETFSLESLLECQETIFKDKNNTGVLNDGERFFKTLFSSVKIEDKIKYLKSGQLEPEVIEILIDRIKYDPHFELFKNEIESLGYIISPPSEIQQLFDEIDLTIEDDSDEDIETIDDQSTNEVEAVDDLETADNFETIDDTETDDDFEETDVDEQTPIEVEPVDDTEIIDDQSNNEAEPVNDTEETDVDEQLNTGVKNYEAIRQKYDISTEQGMNKLLVDYAEVNEDYYNMKQERTSEDSRKRRNLNVHMKRILQNKLKNEKDLETGLNLNSFVETNFSDGLIEEITKDKGAALELFDILSKGVREKDGEKTRLTQKQRQSLASVLEKVSEKKLEMDSPQKNIDYGLEY